MHRHAVEYSAYPRGPRSGPGCSVPRRTQILLRNIPSLGTISRLYQRSRARRSATISDRRSAPFRLPIGCRGFGGFCHIVAERLVGERAASRRRQFGVDTRFWRPSLRRRQTRAPEKHFKPLQRYYACGTGTSWWSGNRYTGDHVALSKVRVTLATQRL